MTARARFLRKSRPVRPEEGHFLPLSADGGTLQGTPAGERGTPVRYRASSVPASSRA